MKLQSKLNLKSRMSYIYHLPGSTETISPHYSETLMKDDMVSVAELLLLNIDFMGSISKRPVSFKVTCQSPKLTTEIIGAKPTLNTNITKTNELPKPVPSDNSCMCSWTCCGGNSDEKEE